MKDTVLQVQMLGDLTLSLGKNKISEAQNRSKKMWTLLAYLLYHRNRTVSQEELLGLLWGTGSGHNPVSAMKTAMHRTRALMDDLSENIGHQLIVNREGGYHWNADFPMELDIERFEHLCHAQNDSDPMWLEDRLEALSLYHGNFLQRMSSELWVIPIATYYQSLYIQAAQKILPTLEERGLLEQVAEVCCGVLQIDPYNEPVYRHMMRTKILQGDQNGAMTLYEELSRRLSADFGVMPGEETRSLYREAMKTVGEQYLPLELVQTHLKEEEGQTGAMVCDYSFFRLLCYAQARAMARTDMEAHVALLSVTDNVGKTLPKADRTLVMDHLETRSGQICGAAMPWRAAADRSTFSCSPEPVTRTAAWSVNESSNPTSNPFLVRRR